MENVTFFTVEGIENVLIDKGNNEFSGMTKAEYDRQQAEQSTPMVADE